MGLSLLISLPPLINSPLIYTPFPSRAGGVELMGQEEERGVPAPVLYYPTVSTG